MSLKHQLLKVVVRVAQYRMILTGESRGSRAWLHKPSAEMIHSSVFLLLLAPTDYLNNLSPDSREYEDTQGT